MMIGPIKLLICMLTLLLCDYIQIVGGFGANRNSGWRSCRQTNLVQHATTTIAGFPSTSSTADNPWKRYFIEFRGILAEQRLSELEEAINFLLSSTPTQPLRYDVAIPDTISTTPIAIFTYLPNDTIASAVAARCATVRTIMEVWGEGTQPQDVYHTAMTNFHTLIRPHFPTTDNTTANSWKVDFQRYGRTGKSGLDPAGKRDLLQTFDVLLKSLQAPVDLIQPTHTLRYLEDWHEYHDLEMQGLVNAADTERIGRRNCFFGRVIAYGTNINHVYALSDRSFVGTTSMRPINAHVACVLARIAHKDVVLDPFCGTASVLIAAAHLQATVIGSDIADDFSEADDALFAKVEAIESNLMKLKSGVNSDNDFDCDDNNNGSDHNNNNTNNNTDEKKVKKQRKKESLVERALGSKNTRFLRRNGASQWRTRPIDSFVQYQLDGRVQKLFQADAHDWLVTDADECTNRVIKRMVFDAEESFYVDAIVSDPPFGRREKFWSLAELSQSTQATSSPNSSDDNSSNASDNDNDNDNRNSNTNNAAAVSSSEGETTTSQTQELLSRSFMTEGGVLQMGDPYGAIPLLLQIALLRLRKPAQRLVFWLPTDSEVSEEIVRQYLTGLCAQYHYDSNNSGDKTTSTNTITGGRRKMRLIRVCREEMSSALTRWLCALELIMEDSRDTDCYF